MATKLVHTTSKERMVNAITLILHLSVHQLLITETMRPLNVMLFIFSYVPEGSLSGIRIKDTYIKNMEPRG